MDKELLRLVIIVSGVVVFLGMLLLSVFQSRKSRIRNLHYGKKNPLDNIDESLIVNLSEDDFDIIPLGSAREEDADQITIKKADNERIQWSDRDDADQPLFEDFEEFEDFDIRDGATELQESEKQTKQSDVNSQTAGPKSNQTTMPDLIQFSLVAIDDAGFNGAEIATALKEAGLVYGNMKIFERLDDNRQVDFGVASMVNPGTFPEQDLHLFSCPGVVFFMQPKLVDDPLAVFNDLISLVFLLSRQLRGELWDAQRQPLTEETIKSVRQSLTG